MNDFRVGLRLLWKDKAFTVTAALTLAVCIGANTALFSVVHHVLLRPLPFADADRVVLLANRYPGAGVDIGGSSSAPDYFDRLRETTVFDEQAMYNSNNVAVDQNGTPTRIRIMNVTPSFFRVLQIAPRLGRTFTDAESTIGNEKKAVLSYALWQSQFGGDPSVVGRDLRLDGQPYSIVGVMPQGFAFLNEDVLLWRPIAFTDRQKSDNSRHSNNWRNIARLKRDATIAQAQAQIDALNTANLDRFPQYKQILINARFHTTVTRLQDDFVRDVRATLYLMWGGAIFVLLIGCVNVANLVLVRSRARIKELATRLALGAGRLRVARQLVIESVILTMTSAAAGLGVGYVTLRLLGALSLKDLPRGYEIRLDVPVILFTLGVAAAIGLVLGLIPAASVLPANLTTVLREEGRSSTTGRGARTLRRALVVAQVGFAFVLLVGAGLLFASFRRVLAIDPGFDPKNVLTASISLPRGRYPDDKPIAFIGDALARIRALPGVTAAGITDTIPFGGNHSDSVILAEGYQMRPGESLISPNQVHVSPGYFEAMRATRVRGRFFDDRDAPKAPRVIIVDEKLAQRFWPNQDPVGRRMYLPDDINNLMAITPQTVFFTVVGVVHDIRLADLVTGNGEVGSYYFPIAQSQFFGGGTFAIRTTTDAAALSNSVRELIAGLDRELPVFEMQTMEERTDHSLMTRRSPVMLSLSFGAVALFLSAIGIYGVLAYLVTQRTKEIGIRIALGGSARSIFELVLREGLALIAVGFVIGIGGAFALRKSLATQLVGVSATDPTVIVAATTILAAVAIVACALPARRATRIDPIVALAD
jgi:predicted permease